MKKMMVGSIVAFSIGAGMMAVALSNKNTKNNATKLVNNAMKVANQKIENMK